MNVEKKMNRKDIYNRFGGFLTKIGSLRSDPNW